MPSVRATQATPISKKIDVICNNLQKRKTGRPCTVKTLAGTINALFKKALSEEELEKLIRELQKQKLITITDTKVSYHFAA